MQISKQNKHGTFDIKITSGSVGRIQFEQQPDHLITRLSSMRHEGDDQMEKMGLTLDTRLEGGDLRLNSKT